jgi:hypothetical protein
MTVRDGSADWRGDVLTGSGKINVGDGVFEGPYSFASRFEESSNDSALRRRRTVPFHGRSQESVRSR